MVIGEFALIERIREYFGKERSRDVFIGIGDDCGVIEQDSDRLLLFTTDMLVEGVHFSCKTHTPYQIGWKALAVNISDIAAMAGLPKYCVVSLGLPSSKSLEFVDDLYRGISGMGAEFGVDIVGGDTVKSDSLVINIALLGEVEREYLTRRSGARVGDKIVVTGTIGDSACGLAVLEGNDSWEIEEEAKEYVIKRHLSPYPRVHEAQRIKGLANSMIDISDGLTSDIVHIAEASGVGVDIFMERLPISSETRIIAKLLARSPIEFALYGGEDYELLFTIEEEALERLEIPVTVIGEITEKTQGLRLLDGLGNAKPLVPKGYEHIAINNS